MKKLSITILLIFFIMAMGLGILSYTLPGKGLAVAHVPGKVRNYRLLPSVSHKPNAKATEAKRFAQKNNLSTSFCFLVDMSPPSYRKRFFVYNMQKDSIITSGLVTHGNCNQYWLVGRKYDNAVGCGCTSLGKYKTGYAYTGRFGLAFKLYGLEQTNSNAFARYVVLHSHSCVPEDEIDSDICQSNGCPTVSPGFLKTLEVIIKGSKKPILLWIFD